MHHAAVCVVRKRTRGGNIIMMLPPRTAYVR